MSLWRAYYHLVWGAKNRAPLITPDIEKSLYGYIIGKADALDSIVHAINGTTDHIHVVVSIRPQMRISEWVRRIKGSSSHYVNHNIPEYDAKFGWQRGYGVFTLGYKQLDRAVAYVRNQKVHHEQGSTIDMLERYDQEDNPPTGPWHNGEALAGIPVVKVPSE